MYLPHSAATINRPNCFGVPHILTGSSNVSVRAIRGALTVAVVSALLLVSIRTLQAQTCTNIYSAPIVLGSNFPVPGPQAGLVFDDSGNLYGTTVSNGFTAGLVFELSPNGSGGWNGTTIHTFGEGKDGSGPGYGPLLYLGGNLYGTTIAGGAHGYGTVYKLSPSGTGWTETVVYSFSGGPYNSYPINGLIADAAGNLLGTTFDYPNTGSGAVFELTPSASGWTEKLIFAYPTGNDAGLVMDSAGKIFGIGSVGGDSSVYELSPINNTGWNKHILYTFTAAQGSGSINGTLAIDPDGNLYGASGFGGAYSEGTVFRLSPTRNGAFEYRDVYDFEGAGEDEQGPFAGVTLDAARNIYGTTVFQGPGNYGTIFKLSPLGEDKYSLTSLSSNTCDGIEPFGALLLDGTGVLYGTSAFGGINQEGNAFEVTF